VLDVNFYILFIGVHFASVSLILRRSGLGTRKFCFSERTRRLLILKRRLSQRECAPGVGSSGNSWQILRLTKESRKRGRRGEGLLVIIWRTAIDHTGLEGCILGGSWYPDFWDVGMCKPSGTLRWNKTWAYLACLHPLPDPLSHESCETPPTASLR